jgi:hypothetical protein
MYVNICLYKCKEAPASLDNRRLDNFVRKPEGEVENDGKSSTEAPLE